MNQLSRRKYVLAFLALATLSPVIALVTLAQIGHMDESQCSKSNGAWLESSPTGINGDGAVIVNGPKGYRFVGAFARGLRQRLDNNYTFTCMTNLPQPPTVSNSQQRRCTAPGDDMSVERCDVKGTQVKCEYVNAKDAPLKQVVLGACFTRPSAVKSSSHLFSELILNIWRNSQRLSHEKPIVSRLTMLLSSFQADGLSADHPNLGGVRYE